MAQLTDPQQKGIEAALQAGNKIEAIKLYREAVPGAGLAEAKEWVEKLERELPPPAPAVGNALPKKGGCLGMVSAVLTLVVLGTGALLLVVVLIR
jgi:hypothetical protein